MVVTDDLYQITGYVASDSETAIVQPTSGGLASDVFSFHVEMRSLDISGLPMIPLLGPDFMLALLTTDQFTTGATAYLSTITHQNDTYEFWCDDDWNDYVANTYNCANIVAQSYADLDSDGEANDPVAAFSLDDVIGTPAEFESGAVFGTGQWLGEGRDSMGFYNIEAILISDDGTTIGANPMVKIIKFYYDTTSDWADREELGETTFEVANVGGFNLVQWDLNSDELHDLPSDEDMRMPFLFEETELDGMTLIRRGERRVAGSEEVELLFNGSALNDFLNAFSSPSSLP